MRRTAILLLGAPSAVIACACALSACAPLPWPRALPAALQPPTLVSLALDLAGTLVLLAAAVWYARLRSAIAAPPPVTPPPRYPSLSVVRPVRGRDPGAEANLRAALTTGYPGPVETLFIFDDEADPGLPLARRVVAEHRAAARSGHAEVLVAGPPPPARTGKLNAMALGERHATGELIAFGDSDTRPDPHVLPGVVAALLSDPNAGAAFAPVLVPTPPRAAGDALYALMLNALYSPLAAYSAGPRRELPFIMGQLMVFRRPALQAIGGVLCAHGQFVDDMHLGAQLHRAGYHNRLSRAVLHIHTEAMSLRAFLPVCRRWLSFSRSGLPWSFTRRQWWLGLLFYLALALLLLALRSPQPLAGLPAALALAFIGWSQLALHHSIGGGRMPARLWWTGWGIFLIAPIAAAWNLLDHHVEWRGRRYQLDPQATLHSTSDDAPPARPPRHAPGLLLLLLLLCRSALADPAPATDSAQPSPVTLSAQDASGQPYHLESERGKVVAVVTLSRYTSNEAAPVADALGAEVRPGKVVSLSVIDMVGIPGMFKGMARRKVVSGSRGSPLRFLVDDKQQWRRAFAVRPDKQVDILVLDQRGALRGHFIGRAQLSQALQLIRALRDNPAPSSP